MRIDFTITASNHISSPSHRVPNESFLCPLSLEQHDALGAMGKNKKSDAFFLSSPALFNTLYNSRFANSKLALGKGTIWRWRCIESSSFRHLERSAARNWCRARTHPELLRVRRVHRWRRSRCSARRRRHRTARCESAPAARARSPQPIGCHHKRTSCYSGAGELLACTGVPNLMRWWYNR